MTSSSGPPKGPESRAQDGDKGPNRFAGARSPVAILLENIRSAYNVGSIFRTSDAGRIRHLYLCGMTPYPPHPKLDKTALGALDHVPWSHHVEAAAAVLALKESGAKIVACETAEGAENYWAFRAEAPLVLLFGHEVAGLSPELLRLADGRLRVPMWGFKSSLNVATACGVVLFEVLRQLVDRKVWTPGGEC